LYSMKIEYCLFFSHPINPDDFSAFAL